MSTEQPWDKVDVLVPKRILLVYERGLEDVREDVTAFVEAIPNVDCLALEPSGPVDLAEADPEACKAWVSRIIAALPTTADLEAIRGNF